MFVFFSCDFPPRRDPYLCWVFVTNTRPPPVFPMNPYLHWNFDVNSRPPPSVGGFCSGFVLGCFFGLELDSCCVLRLLDGRSVTFHVDAIRGHCRLLAQRFFQRGIQVFHFDPPWHSKKQVANCTRFHPSAAALLSSQKRE